MSNIGTFDFSRMSAADQSTALLQMLAQNQKWAEEERIAENERKEQEAWEAAEREAKELAAGKAARKAAKKGKKWALVVEVESGAEEVANEQSKPKKWAKTAETIAEVTTEVEDGSLLEIAEVSCKK
jgi:hypothetical protein